MTTQSKMADETVTSRQSSPPSPTPSSSSSEIISEAQEMQLSNMNNIGLMRANRLTLKERMRKHYQRVSDKVATRLCAAQEAIEDFRSLDTEEQKLIALSKTAAAGSALASAVNDINQFMTKYKITPAVAIITAVVNAPTPALKAANLVALFDLYSSGNGRDMVANVYGCVEHISSFFGMVLDIKDQKEDLTVVLSEMDTAIEQSQKASFSKADETVLIDMTTGEPCVPPRPSTDLGSTPTEAASNIADAVMDKAQDSFQNSMDFIAKHERVIRPIIGFLALLAATMGFTEMLKFEWISKSQKSLASLASYYKNKQIVTKEVEEATDSIFSIMYEMAGKTYIPKKKKECLTLAEKIRQLDAKCHATLRSLQSDVFGEHANIAIPELEVLHEQLSKELSYIMANDKSLYNFGSYLMNIRTNINTIRDRQTQIIAMTGKQEPVKVWLYGAAGIGKSKVGNLIRDMLNVTEYPRDVTDQYWSNYASQYICRYDDILQRKDHRCAQEWHTNASENATSVSGAAIATKGMPFRSPMMLATSNTLDLLASPVIADLDSFNRRRDILVYMYNPAAVAYRKEVGTNAPPSFFQQNPTRYFLIKACFEAGHDGAPITDTTVFGHRRTIGEIDLPMLVTMIQNRVLLNKEKYRLDLLTKPQLANYITIPQEPIKYDEQYTDFRRITDMYQSATVFALKHLEGADDLVEAIHEKTKDPYDQMYAFMRASSSDLSSMSLEAAVEYCLDPTPKPEDAEQPQSYKFEPIRTNYKRHRFAVILSTPPGFGKTHILEEELFKTWEGPKRLINAAELSDPNFSTAAVLLEEKMIFVDDFTLHNTAKMNFKVLHDAFYANTTKFIGLIASCNDMLTGQEKELIQRRAHFIETKPTFRHKVHVASRTAQGKPAIPLWQRRREANGDVAAIRKWVTISNTGEPNRNDCDLTPLSVSAYIRMVTSDVQELETYKTYNEWELPYPDHYDMLVKSDLTVADLRAAEGVLGIIQLSHRFSIQDAAGKALPLSELLQHKTVALQLVKADFVQDNRYVTSEFNKLNVRLNKPTTIVVKTPDYCYGFIQPDVDDICLMYKLVEGPVPPIQWKDSTSITIDGIVYEDPASEPARRALMKMFDQRLLPATPAILAATDAEIGSELVKTSPAWQALIAAVDIGLLVVRGMAIGTLCASLGVRTTSQEVADNSSAEEMESQVHATNGIPAKANAPSKRNDANKQPTPTLFVKEEKKIVFKAGYEAGASRALQAQLVRLESRAENFALVQHDDGTFGVHMSSKIFFAEKKNPGCYIGRMYPITPQWKVVDLTKLNGTYTTGKGKATYPITFERTKLHDMCAYERLIGKKFQIQNMGLDLNSIVAFSYATGVPFDATNRILAPTAAVQLWNQVDQAPPMALQLFMQQRFKSSFNEMKTFVRPEAMVDPQASEQSDLILQNAVQFKLNGHHHVHGIMLRERIGITVRHCDSSSAVVDPRTGKEYSWQTVYGCKDFDIQIFEITDKTSPMWGNVMKHIVTNQDLTQLWADVSDKIPVALTVPPAYGKARQCDRMIFTDMRPNVVTKQTGQLAGSKAVYGTFLQQLSIQTGVSQEGDCGAPVLIVNPTVAHKWCGIHRAGSQTTSIGSIITREFIDSIVNKREAPQSARPPAKLPELLDLDENPESIESSGLAAEISLEGVTIFDEIVQDEETGLNQIGEIAKPIHLPTQTKLRRTGIHIEGYDDCEPAILDRQDPRGDGTSMYSTGVARYGVKIPALIDEAEIGEAFLRIGNEYANTFLSNQQEVRIWTKTEAINRPPFAQYPMAKPLDRSGSAGFPHIWHGIQRKNDLLEFNEKQERWYFKKDTYAQRVSSKIDQMIEDANNGIPHLNPFVAYCKDEVVPLKKIYDATRKTRIFFSGTAEYLIAYRMYFGAAMQRMMEHNGTLPPKVGISANTCGDWNNLAYRLAAKSSENCFATDLKNYDSSINSAFIRGVKIVYDEIYNRCSPPSLDRERARRIRDILHESVESANVIVGDKIFKLDQAMVSGCPGTALENSLVIWALYYIVWRRLAYRNKRQDVADYNSFRDIVELAIYGDDNIASVKPGYEWFNFQTFRDEALTMGFQVTDALKTGEKVAKYTPLEQLDFLQRGFKRIGSFWAGPLSHRSIGKALHWVHDGKAYQVPKDILQHKTWPQSHNTPLLEGALNAQWGEIALLGKEEYNRIRDELLRQAPALSIQLDPPLWHDAMAMQGYFISSEY